MFSAESLSVFFPAYNDAPSLPLLISRTFETLEQHVGEYEVIVVNDGSHDNTGEVLAKLATQYAPHMRVVTHPQNRGYGGALRSGFAAATKDLVFYTDGDAQYDPCELSLLHEQLAQDVDMVQGWKIERQDGWQRRLVGRVYHHFVSFLF